MAELFVGLMSGTSLDAVDAVLVELGDPARPRLVGQHAEPIPTTLRQALLALARSGEDELDRMARLDNQLARLLARAARAVLAAAGVAPAAVRAIGSHGQTVRHAPFGPEPYTVQLGNPSLIAELTGITTVADFRRRDLAAGGQGAPLAPAFHAAFFRRPGAARAVVNVGGIANVTLLPAEVDRPVIGFDTGPGNVLLDVWAERHLGTPVDRHGAWAAGGRMRCELLERCLQDPFFTRPPPKSTGREYFNLDWLQQRLAGQQAAAQDVQTTLVELTAASVAAAVKTHAPATTELLVCGGGVHNRTLLAILQRHLKPVPVQSTAARGVDPDYMEAIGFAWLAQRTLNGLPGNLPEVTGAHGPRILGGIYPA